MDARRSAERGVALEGEEVALVEVHGAAGEGAKPKLRPLQVDEDADWTARFLLERANHRHALAHDVMRGVAHVDAEDVGAGGEQGGDGLAVARGGAEGGDDLCSAATDLHFTSPTIGGACRCAHRSANRTLRIRLVGQLHRPALGVLAGVDFEEAGAIVAAHKAILPAVDLELAI